MIVSITFCPICWGYRERASVLAEELRARMGVEVHVTEGKLGQFDVRVDSELVAARGKTFLSRMKPGAPPEVATLIATIEPYLSPRAEGSN